jgi:DNA-binding NtrC family response regulator
MAMLTTTQEENDIDDELECPLHWRLVLVVEAGETLKLPQMYLLDDEHENRIGRDPKVGLTMFLDDKKVSGLHATIRRDGKRWLIFDESSTNGVSVNGVRVTAAPIDAHCVIGLASQTFAVLNYGVELVDSAPPAGLEGRSFAAQQLFRQIMRLGPTGATVLFLGETGVGKSGCAKALHEFSGRKGSFIELNCASLEPDLLESTLFGHERGAFTDAVAKKTGFVEEASGGTLFLDEIGELPPRAQAKLLTFLDTRKFRRVGATAERTADVRIVCATNRDLKGAIREGKFREDLYSRIAAPSVAIPPLRERREDIPLLLEHRFKGANEAEQRNRSWITPAVLQALMVREWKRNIREFFEFVDKVKRLPPGADYSDLEFLAALVQPKKSPTDSPKAVIPARSDQGPTPNLSTRASIDVVLETIARQGRVTQADVKVTLRVSARRAQQILKEMEKMRLIARIGQGSHVYYVSAN